MARQVRIELRSGEIARLLKSRPIRSTCRTSAEKVAAVARQSAPVATGKYRASIHVESATTDRAVERVVADAPHALVVEAKTGNLARAVDG